MKYKLINIGWDKVTREVNVDNNDQLLKEVERHLLSRFVALATDDDGESFRVYAGVRRVGTVERVES